MNKPKGYDETEVFGNFKKLPKGGYVCKIKKLEEGKNELGAEQLIIYLDIADGEFKNIFMDRYVMQTNVPVNAKKWPCITRRNVLDTTTGQTSKAFKGLMTSIEESNAGFIVDKCWGENFCKYFKDKLVGCVFGEEFFIGTDGKEHSTVKPRVFMSIDKIKKGDFKIPEDTHQAEQPQSSAPSYNDEPFPVPGDDDVPF